MRDHDTDSVAFVSDTLYHDVVTRFDDLTQILLRQVDIEVKNYRATAHLLIT